MKVSFQGEEYVFYFRYLTVHVDEKGRPTGQEPFPEPQRMDFLNPLCFGVAPTFDERAFQASNRSWHHGHREACECVIALSRLCHGEPAEPVRARVIRHKNDTPNRRVGREAALRKSLEMLRRDVVCSDNHERRRNFWAAYFTACKPAVRDLAAGEVGQ